MPADQRNSKSRASPYKKVQQKNSSHTGYISMSKLDVNMAYRMIDLIPTNHEKFGKGELATLVDSRNARWKVQLPNKYLKELDEDVEIIRKDVDEKRYPYVVYRGKMEDGSFKMDLIPKGPEIDQQYQNFVEIPEVKLNTSASSDKSDAQELSGPDKS